MWRVVVLALLVATGRAGAEDDWDKGVSEKDRLAANALYKEGNQLFAQQAYPAALEKYKAAVALWDHPKIRLNLAISEIEVEHILDAAEDLDAALRYGQTPFKPEEYSEYQQALKYQKLLRGRVGTLEVRCSKAGSVLLDGKPWLECPRTQAVKVLAGEHVLLAEAKGYMTLSRHVVVAGGKTAHEELSLLPIESAVKLVYPSPRWLPWTAIGTGVAIGLGGFGVWYSGRREMDRYNSQFDMICMHACSENLDANPVEQQLAEQRDDARLKGTIGITVMIVGGAIGVAGGVWEVLNRPQRVMPKVEVAPTGGGIAARATWRF